MSEKNHYPKWLPWILVAGVLLGVILRFVWTQDIEYKFDEQYMFARSQNVGVTEPWPGIGMPSGVGLRNPGMSIWVLVALARVFQATTPVGLTQAVIFLNCLALLVLCFIAFRMVKPAEREGWIWAIMLASVNPVAIQLQRKIWAQSVLPVFCALFLASWLKRGKNWGAFAWGLIGACLGQIHMSGFFFGAAVFLWTAWKDRKSVRWMAWLGGSVLGSVSLIPWVSYVFSGEAAASSAAWQEFFRFRFWSEWIMQSLGFSVSYSLGHNEFQNFLSFPTIMGIPSYAMGIAHLAAILAGIGILVVGLLKLRDRGFKADGTDTEKIVNAGFFGFGALVTLGRVFVYRHYLIVAYPLQFLWLARMGVANQKEEKVSKARVLLIALIAAQLAISVGFLSYIHLNGGAPEGDYGTAYSSQR